MQPRRKPIPSPIARPTDLGLAPRPLRAARSSAVLPTVAALLAMAAIGCERSAESITRDEATVAMGNTLASQHGSTELASPRHHDPSEPLPALGVIEDPPPPPPPPATPLPPPPPKHPYPVKGGLKAVHPMPTAPVAAGGGAPVHPPPIAPIKKPVKLGGDVAPAYPETT